MTIAKYKNGNTKVILEDDGTKIREWEGIPKPLFPESVDLKITDYCGVGCSFCHEGSSRNGKHASIETIQRVIQGLPKGVEIAIGGGNPLAHPQLYAILKMMKRRGLIANMTISAWHLCGNQTLIGRLRARRLIHGLGISYLNPDHKELHYELLEAKDNKTVIHVIAGVLPIETFSRLNLYHNRVLVLGFKQYGRGKTYYNDRIKRELSKWRWLIGGVIKNFKGVISFDNLAIEQLGIKALLDKKTWDEQYMGDDGQFTMYVDAVKDEYAISSIKERKPLNGATIRDIFPQLTIL
jgi:hypothetical protein